MRAVISVEKNVHWRKMNKIKGGGKKPTPQKPSRGGCFRDFSKVMTTKVLG